MKIARRITFIIANDGVAAWKLKRLKALSGFFRSVIILQNITTGKATNSEHILKVMSLGCKRNDLCQLWIEGCDAELACMVLTDFIAEQFAIVNTSHKRSEELSNSIIKSHPTFHLPFAINYSFEPISVHSGIEKNTLLNKLSNRLNKSRADIVFAALQKRETISSTGIGNHIAIPHIMLENIEKPSLVVFKLDSPINWNSKLGEVSLIIAMLIPAPPTSNMVKAFTQISRSLLEPANCNLLTSSTEPEAIKAILFHFMNGRNNKAW